MMTSSPCGRADHDPAWLRMPVLGRSMWPTLRPGDMLLVRLAPRTLQSGDIVVLRAGGTLFVHRFLGYRRCGTGRCLLAKGDGRWAFDPLWPENALLGVVVAVEREEACLPAGPDNVWQRRILLWWHRLQGGMHRRLRLLFTLFLCLGLIVPAAHAAVHLIAFTAAWRGGQVLLQWQTASEIDTLGFNIYRRALSTGAEQLLNKAIIPARGDLAGAAYRFVDKRLPAGPGFSYRLAEVEADGQIVSFTPVTLYRPTATPMVRSPTVAPPPATATARPSATPTSAATPRPTPTPSSTPTATSFPTPIPSSTPTATSFPTPTPSSTPTATSFPTSSFTLTGTPMSTPTIPASPSPTMTSRPTSSPTATPAAMAIVTATATMPGAWPAPHELAPPVLPGRQNGHIYAFLGGLGFCLLAAAALFKWGRKRP